MAAEIKFYAGSGPYGTEVGTGSGIGFYGSSFGASVQVGSYQDSSYMTNSAGSANYGAATNTKYPGNASGVIIDDDPEVQLSGLPLTSGTVNVRFTFDSAVKTQNCELRIYDRTDKDNNPSGVTCQVAQLVNGGSGVSSSGTAEGTNDGWSSLYGSGSTMVMLYSPGSGGLSPSGTDTEDTRHDWYFCLSATPTSIGSKTQFGLWVELEYL